jgi:hypothetical protein
LGFGNERLIERVFEGVVDAEEGVNNYYEGNGVDVGSRASVGRRIRAEVKPVRG